MFLFFKKEEEQYKIYLNELSEKELSKLFIKTDKTYKATNLLFFVSTIAVFYLLFIKFPKISIPAEFKELEMVFDTGYQIFKMITLLIILFSWIKKIGVLSKKIELISNEFLEKYSKHDIYQSEYSPLIDLKLEKFKNKIQNKDEKYLLKLKSRLEVFVNFKETIIFVALVAMVIIISGIYVKNFKDFVIILVSFLSIYTFISFPKESMKIKLIDFELKKD